MTNNGPGNYPIINNKDVKYIFLIYLFIFINLEIKFRSKRRSTF